MQDITAPQERIYEAELLMLGHKWEVWGPNVALQDVSSAFYFLLCVTITPSFLNGLL